MRPPYRDDRYGQRQTDVLPIGMLPYQGMGRCGLARRTQTRVNFL